MVGPLPKMAIRSEEYVHSVLADQICRSMIMWHELQYSDTDSALEAYLAGPEACQ